MPPLPYEGTDVPSLSHTLSRENLSMDLTMCGLLPERAEEIARLYDEHRTWNQVEEVWFEDRRGNRSTRESSQKVYRVLSGRLKNAPASLPNPGDLPDVLDACATARDRAQVLYLYLVAEDQLVRYVVHEYIQRLAAGTTDALDFSNETLNTVLNRFRYADGTPFDYADSTKERWCEGFRSVMRKIGVLDERRTVGHPPVLGDIPLLVAMGYSYHEGDEGWFESPIGLRYLFQPQARWQELYDRVAEGDAWEFVNLHGQLQLRPTGEPYAWTANEGTE